jgi:hypothetical protein
MDIEMGGSTNNLRNIIKDYYHQVWSSEIEVTEECFDVDGQLLLNEAGDQDCNLAETEETVTDCFDSSGASLFPECDSGEVADTETVMTSYPLIDSKVYTIKVLKPIGNNPSCDNIIVAGLFGGNIEVILPDESEGTTSSNPITGSYYLICYDLDGNPHAT